MQVEAAPGRTGLYELHEEGADLSFHGGHASAHGMATLRAFGTSAARTCHRGMPVSCMRCLAAGLGPPRLVQRGLLPGSGDLAGHAEGDHASRWEQRNLQASPLQPGDGQGRGAGCPSARRTSRVGGAGQARSRRRRGIAHYRVMRVSRPGIGHHDRVVDRRTCQYLRGAIALGDG